jgi:hypothetical protein
MVSGLQTIIKRSENRFTSFLAFLFLLGIGIIPVWLAGGITGWVCFGIFAVCSLLPLSSVIRPKTSLLAAGNGKLVWWTAQQSKRTEDGNVPIDNIRKIIRRSQPGGRFVEIQLVLADDTVLVLPQDLMPEVNAHKIISSIQTLSPAIEVVEAAAGDEPTNPSSDAVGIKRPDAPSSSIESGQAQKEGEWGTNERNLWKVTLCFVLVGAGLVVGALTWGISTYRFLQTASRAGGVVRKMEIVSRSGHMTGEFTVAFTDQSGQVRTFTEMGNVQNRPAFTVGQMVRVAYDPTDPSEARIVSFETLWLWQSFLGGMGLLFVVIGSIATWQARKIYT